MKVTIDVEIERKQPDLPRFIVVPSRAIETWGLTKTSVVDVVLNGVDIGRRSIVPWDAGRWFISMSEALCKRAGVDTGDRAALTIARATDALPAELEQLIASDAAARRRWERLSEAQQRMLAENVREAKQSATRERRARKALG